jgi:2'-5' RNA ligase
VSGEVVRAFLAAELPAHAQAQAERAAEALRELGAEGVRWTRAGGRHLTLKFLGSIAAADLPRLARAAAAKLAREESFEVQLGGFGAFPSARSARVVWLGVARGGPELARLARKLDAAAARFGAPREHRPYAAHLTLGRLREPRAIAIERARPPEGAPFAVREVVLFESRPEAGGSRYVPLARLPLGQAEALESEFAPDL